MGNPADWSVWQRFWHEPVRAERLALTRIFLGLALLTDLLFQSLPNLDAFYGPGGVAPYGVHHEWMALWWRWTIWLFHTDELPVVYAAFGLYLAVTAAFTVGWHTRLMGVLVWFLSLCFNTRNPILGNKGQDVLMAGLFLLALAPCGRALSLDRWLERRRRGPAIDEPPTTPAWPVRVLQIQVCMIYLTTGLAKLIGAGITRGEWFEGTWWDGTSLHYVLNDTTMSRWSYAQLPLPLWVTAPATYVVVWWETLFPLLVLYRRTRGWALGLGVLFHLGIFFTIAVGGFSFYTLALYGVWVPDRFWARRPARAPGENGQGICSGRE